MYYGYYEIDLTNGLIVRTFIYKPYKTIRGVSKAIASRIDAHGEQVKESRHYIYWFSENEARKYDPNQYKILINHGNLKPHWEFWK